MQGGSTINTGGHKGYGGIDIDGDFVHFKVSHPAREFVRMTTPEIFVTTNSAESVYAIVRRQFMGTHQWFSKRHTWLYMNENVFRLKEGSCGIATIDRLNSIIRRMFGKRIRLPELTAK